MAEVLTRGIREGVLSPGQTLIQEELARRFGVSRIPVREALRTLAAEGLISFQDGTAVVTRLNREEMEELYELRLQLEPRMAEAVVEACSELDLKRLAKLATDMEAHAGDKERWSKLNYEFHRRMYDL